VRGGGIPKKIASLDPVEEISSADKARLIAGLRRHHSLADLLQAAGVARSTFKQLSVAGHKAVQYER